MTDRSPAARYLPLLVAGDAAGLAAIVGDDPVVDDPLVGRVRGRAELAAFARRAHGWLDEAAATVVPVAETVGGGRAVAEAVLDLVLDDGPVGLPVAVVAEPDGPLAARLRVYHSTWPLSGRHALRPQLLPAVDVELPVVVARYQRALAAGDVDGVLACFEADGAFREPAGAAFRHAGPAALRAAYERLFAAGGGIPLLHCSQTDDGRRCALEYTVVRWGATELPPQAGIAVYERGEERLLREARVYDDVDPPRAA